MARPPYRTFLVWNAAGAAVWAGGLTLLGYAAGNSYAAIEDWVGRGSVAVAIALGGVVLAVLIHRRLAGARTSAAPAVPTD